MVKVSFEDTTNVNFPLHLQLLTINWKWNLWQVYHQHLQWLTIWTNHFTGL